MIVPVWPADAVERRNVADLIPYARNARTHSDDQVAQLAASIREWGFTVPVLVDEDAGVIAGHGRLQAAHKLGLDSVPVIVAKGWTEQQIRAYRIADNKLALNAGWNEEMLALELAELPDLTELMGFAQAEVDRLMAQLERTQGLTDPDEVPEVPEVPETQPGDLWLLGKHRLLCGDCTDAAAVERLLGGVKPNLMVTDPPYGVEYDADWRTHARNGDGSLLSTGKGRAKGAVTNDERADWHAAYALFPGNIAYVWHAGRHASAVQASLAAVNFTVRCQIIWAKNNFAVGRGDYHWQHEPCWYAVRKKGDWHGDRSQSTLWQIDKPQKSETGHSTQKPVECMRRPILNNSSPGQAVYDPFVGSGTTIIAAEMEARIAYAMEISPAYCDVVKTRWENFTGQKATKWPTAPN